MHKLISIIIIVTAVVGFSIAQSYTPISREGTMGPKALESNPPVTYMEEFTAAGYTANAAVTNTGGLTIAQNGKFSEGADKAAWLVSVQDGDSDEGEAITVVDDGPSSFLKILTNDKIADHMNLQNNGEFFKCDSTRDLLFQARIEIGDVSDSIMYIGLGVADTDIGASLGNDFMYFETSSSGVINFKQGKNGTITTNAAIGTFTDGTGTGAAAKTLGVYVDGSAGHSFVYVDGVLAASNLSSTTIPNDEALVPGIYIEGTNSTADALYVDYIRVEQTR